MLYTLFRYLHFLAIFVFAGSLVIENMALKPTINREDARNIAKVTAAFRPVLEEFYRDNFGVKKIIWLKHGTDEGTNGHIDNVKIFWLPLGGRFFGRFLGRRL